MERLFTASLRSVPYPPSADTYYLYSLFLDPIHTGCSVDSLGVGVVFAQ